MAKGSNKVGKGLLWTLVGVFGAVAAGVVGWIIYSWKYIQHHLKLNRALDVEPVDYQSDHAGRLSYYFDSNGSGVPLVLLHSINAASSAFEMKPIFDRFRGSRPVYVLDLPGFGFSDRSNRVYNPFLYQTAIFEFLRDVVGQPADVVTLSLSSEFTGATAVHHPELIRSLIMISPTGFVPLKVREVTERYKKRGAKDALYSGLSVGLWNRPFFDLVSSRPSIKYFLNKSFEGVVPDLMVDYAYVTSHQTGAEHAPTYFLSGKLFTPAVRETVYRLITQPVLVIYDRDPYTNFEMLPLMLKELENWQGVRICPTKGLPHWEEPGKTWDAMTRFWEGIA
jgi:pimeloyl-ACP methyl ester carboxylesterase